ncbi:MAG: heat-shock protein [Blastocatellia bacterium]|nr:MAG: heat-shock protein [Blastocatellia bacterium]
MSQQWNPLHDLIHLQDRMNRLFEDATQRQAGRGESTDGFERADWHPLADVFETETEYLIALDLPGIDRDALEVDVDDNRLTLKGVRVIDEATQHRSERPRGKFYRTFAIPKNVDQALVSAQYRDGVLLLSLPKRKEQKAQRVEIKVS